ncbi:uncharacterized protein LOC122536048 isoform X1 [Frieseomelitta varia]|uniref:uncharacterized protein LOC122536048 isoform X1 n=1 Tax=Frieseomelitta varia TaxID=561572 RepID=UPI001CB69472|nr:uncharacterized protein LOC122536048 isoform X1 [Frieseomelitta varia]
MLSKRLEVRIGSSISVSRTPVGKYRSSKRNRFAVKTPMDEITTLLCQIINTEVLKMLGKIHLEILKKLIFLRFVASDLTKLTVYEAIESEICFLLWKYNNALTNV